MEIITRTLRMVLLLLVASILVAKIECAPSQRTRTGETDQYLNKNELLRLFQEDAQWASSSDSHGKSSEELRGQYQPMPYGSVLHQNSLKNVAGGPLGGTDANNHILVPQPY